MPEALGPTIMPVMLAGVKVFPVFDGVSVYVPGFTKKENEPSEPEVTDPVVGPPLKVMVTPVSPTLPLITNWLSVIEVDALELAVPSVTVTVIVFVPAVVYV
jgi:hypothetical protein